ncbi:hypothetical protein [Flavobacterium sp.]|uniref:hypothetical protein n=1 Tax=Flavobacterium sp. TaxID=239 RepID=UPI0024886659|nr:hypothetical protein [Flavobacterium sp.]MDI1315795.1 hypothetical protein [Flavobacterium sp.]
MVNSFEVGNLVTFKSHPLLQGYEIKGDGKYVPPIMIIKEVHFEDKKKKTHDDVSGFEIAERIKYICVYFDDNKSEFIEVHIYQNMLKSIHDLKIGRLDDPDKFHKGHQNLVDEILDLPLKPSYQYAGIFYFKTKKLEVLKKRSSIRKTSEINEDGTPTEIKRKRMIQYVVNYTTPDFIVCGYKNETYTDLFYNNGDKKRLASMEFVKVKWYSPFQQKFSEQYLPIEFFTDINPFPINSNNE